jgi:hypothetical protein
MISNTFFIIAAALLSFVRAQSTDPALEIEAIEAHFSGAGIVPSLLATFDPSAILAISYDGVGSISPGQQLTQEQVGSAPTLTVTAANSSVVLAGNFTLAMVDAGPVGSDESLGQTRHWLVNGVTVSSSVISNASAVAITSYAGPAPPAGSGPHRYVVLLYTQPSTFSPPTDLSQPNVGVSVFNVNDYVKTSGLGPIVAANYFTVEEGQATVSLSATSAVISSTLLPSSSVKPSGTLSSTLASATQSGKPNGAPSFFTTSPLAIALVATLGFFVY